jgi:hypothetical protein
LIRISTSQIYRIHFLSRCSCDTNVWCIFFLTWRGLLTQLIFPILAAPPLVLELLSKELIFSLIQFRCNPLERYFQINQTMAPREKARTKSSKAIIEEYALLIDGVSIFRAQHSWHCNGSNQTQAPLTCRWQELKDFIREYAPHNRQAEMYEDENGKPTGQGSVIVRGLEEAQRAYGALVVVAGCPFRFPSLTFYRRGTIAERLGWALHHGGTGQTRERRCVRYD